MEERNPIPQGTGNLSHKVCRVVYAPYWLKEQRAVLGICAEQTAVLGGQKPRIEERVRTIRLRLLTEVCRSTEMRLLRKAFHGTTILRASTCLANCSIVSRHS